MSPSVVCYEESLKQKSRQVLRAFAAGCGGRMASTTAIELEPGAAAFYGVREPWAHLWAQAKREGRDWFYLDNAYHDVARERYFRATKNAIQHTGGGETDGARLRALGLAVKPMRTGGDYVLVCAQSEEFMRVVAGDPGWIDRTLSWLRGRGDEVVIRRKGEKRPLADDLHGARELWTWSSAAAVTALLEGVPVACSAQCCAADVIDRETWAGVLADQQWTLDEMRSGIAWKALSACAG